MSVNSQALSWHIFLIILISIVSASTLVMAEEGNISPQSEIPAGIYDGSIPSGDGIVVIKASTGKLYQIPSMTPLGVIQTLAGTDIIENYKVGDELIVKMGLLTLDGINGLVASGDNSWFALVNDKQLMDYQLPKEHALNSFQLKTGDVVLFAYGNPTKPVSEAQKTLRVTIGSQPESGGRIVTTENIAPTPVPSETPVSTIDTSTQQPTPQPTQSDLTQPVYEDEQKAGNPTPEPTATSAKTESDPNQPVYEDEQKAGNPTPEPTETSAKAESDPNQPVYEDEKKAGNPTPEPTATSAKVESDPNQPAYEDEQKAGNPIPEPTATSAKAESDPNQPVYEDGNKPITETPTPTHTPEEKVSDQNEITTESGLTDTTEPKSESETDEKTSKAPAGQEVLFSGTFSLPSGNVNLSADSGMEYDVPGKTPLGLLQALQADGKVSSMTISDKGMNKGGILSLLSINDYSWGEEAWFVQVNDQTLKDYFNPATDGLNIKSINTGDKVTYYYGKMDQTPATAKAAIYVTLD